VANNYNYVKLLCHNLNVNKNIEKNMYMIHAYVLHLAFFQRYFFLYNTVRFNTIHLVYRHNLNS